MKYWQVGCPENCISYHKPQQYGLMLLPRQIHPLRNKFLEFNSHNLKLAEVVRNLDGGSILTQLSQNKFLSSAPTNSTNSAITE